MNLHLLIVAARDGALMGRLLTRLLPLLFVLRKELVFGLLIEFPGYGHLHPWRLKHFGVT